MFSAGTTAYIGADGNVSGTGFNGVTYSASTSEYVIVGTASDYPRGISDFSMSISSLPSGLSCDIDYSGSMLSSSISFNGSTLTSTVSATIYLYQRYSITTDVTLSSSTVGTITSSGYIYALGIPASSLVNVQV